MRQRTAKETAMICVTAMIIVGILIVPFELAAQKGNSSKGVIFLAGAVVIALGLVLGFRYLTVRKHAQLELEGSDQYRKLADEYRRLADLAITAQEHTDLKLGDVSVQLDYLREQNASLQKILKDVE
jgi:hypothetical protein